MRWHDVSTAVALAVAMTSTAAADYMAEEVPAHERCALCHGLFGDSARDRFPKLAGQRQAYIEAQIRAFLSGARSNDGGQMAAVVTELAPGEIAEVAAWFASQPAPGAIPAPGSQAGARAYLSAGCDACHDEAAAGSRNTPFLSSQHPAYLAKQMRDIRDGRRAGAASDVMRSRLESLDDADLDAIAAYLAARDRTE
ncbi:c-type cytochrome [Puniceibacterium confluentis]|uniref:c-type cytochrome n=1 Tax=Puniceibacterium confluentis TaxID=1958944 RepID=UPI0035668FBC